MLAEIEFQNVDPGCLVYQLTHLPLLSFPPRLKLPHPLPIAIFQPSPPDCLEPHIIPTLFTVLVLGAGCPGLAMRGIWRSERIPLPHPQPQALEEKGLAAGGVWGEILCLGSAQGWGRGR